MYTNEKKDNNRNHHISFYFLLCIIGKQYHSLSLYENGFNHIGTYATNDNERYIVFSDNSMLHTYKQFAPKKNGTYEKTENPNLYRVMLPGENTTTYALMAKDSLYLIENNKITIFQKISDGRININIIDNE